MYYTIFRYLEIKGVLIMKTIINLKTLLSILSLVVFLLGSCKAGDKLGSVTQDSQISGGGENSGESVSNGLNTSLPIWNVKHSPIPEEYWGKYLDLEGNHIATVTGRDITFYYEDYDGNLKVWEYYHVFDKKAEYQGNNTWWWPYFYRGNNYINKYKNDFRFSIPPDDQIITFERNEKGQRVLFYNRLGHYFNYFHEDDINK